MGHCHRRHGFLRLREARKRPTNSAYSDGTQAEFDTSASTTQDWTFWDTTNQTAFAEYTYALPEDWNLKVSYNYRDYKDDSKLFFAWSTVGLDKATGLGLFGNPGSWPTKDEAHLLDVTVDGDFSLFGREHQAILGVNYSTGKRTQYWLPVDGADSAFGALPAFPYAGNAIAEPVWGPKTVYGVTDQQLKRFYGASKLSLSDKLAAVVGFNFAEYHRDGLQTGTPFDQTERELSPYAGLTWSIRDNLLAYELFRHLPAAGLLRHQR